MKTILSLALALALLTAKGQSAIDLATGSQVRNSIIFGNLHAAPVSTETSVMFSASDSILPAGSNNVHLPLTPFSSGFGFEINMGSLAFDRGSTTYLNPTDTVDAAFNPRVSCKDVDIGAYEHFVLPTQITVQPTLAGRVCEGRAVLLQVEAVGEGITFQWQRNGVNLIGRTSPMLAIPNVSMADTGDYRVIVFGACCNDTSNVVRLDVDLRPMVVAMSDTTVLSGGSATLYVKESIGTVVWFKSDMETVVLNPNITNITEGTQFFAVATNGVCLDTAIDPVQIIVDGFVCRVQTHPDPIVCAYDPFRLLIYEATVTARWTALGTGTEVPNGSLVRVPQTTRFVLSGFDKNGNVCDRDTITIIVPTLDFTVREDVTVCRDVPVLLYSTPPADVWFNDNNQSIGSGNVTVVPPLGATTVYTAQLTEPVSGCVFRRQASITANPPDLHSLIGTQIAPQNYVLTVCEDDLIHLQTNIDPLLTDWRQNPDGENLALPNDPSFTAIATETPTLFRAWAWNEICGDIYLDIEITVQPKPEFVAMPQPPIYAGTSISLTSVPNTPIWVDMDGTRVFMPITLQETQSFIGVFQQGVCEVRDTILVEVMDNPPPPPPPPLAMQVTFANTTASNRDCDNATLAISVTGGVPPYDFEWRRLGYDDVWQQPYNAGELRLFNVVAGVYLFTVLDSEDSLLQFQIPVRCEHEQIMPSILVTPNNDGLNDYLFIYEIEFFPKNRVTIINSYGAEVITIENFCNYDPNRRWDGRNRNKQFVPDGTYWYVIQAEGVPPMTGWIIVRGSPGR